jgi:hypothetical protein
MAMVIIYGEEETRRKRSEEERKKLRVYEQINEKSQIPLGKIISGNR